ncbi:hypothetical protein FI667_g4809, partial [Globisporangium splendens]
MCPALPASLIDLGTPIFAATSSTAVGGTKASADICLRAAFSLTPLASPMCATESFPRIDFTAARYLAARAAAVSATEATGLIPFFTSWIRTLLAAAVANAEPASSVHLLAALERAVFAHAAALRAASRRRRCSRHCCCARHRHARRSLARSPRRHDPRTLRARPPDLLFGILGNNEQRDRSRNDRVMVPIIKKCAL